jgi:hypothetical protein
MFPNRLNAALPAVPSALAESAGNPLQRLRRHLLSQVQTQNMTDDIFISQILGHKLLPGAAALSVGRIFTSKLLDKDESQFLHKRPHLGSGKGYGFESLLCKLLINRNVQLLRRAASNFPILNMPIEIPKISSNFIRVLPQA